LLEFYDFIKIEFNEYKTTFTFINPQVYSAHTSNDLSYKIKWTKHAKERAIERDIHEKDVIFVINNPVETVYDERRENYKSFALVNHPLTNKTTYLMVVHSKFNTRVTIISVMWQTTGGLQRNGFNKIR
jgi:hypothetical protein